MEWDDSLLKVLFSFIMGVAIGGLFLSVVMCASGDADAAGKQSTGLEGAILFL